MPVQNNKVDGFIRKLPNSPYWTVKTSDEFGMMDERYFVFSEGAFDYWRKFERESYWRIRGRQLYSHTDLSMLDYKERVFLSKMVRKNFRGMTQKQYGYMKGIQERNPF